MNTEENISTLLESFRAAKKETYPYDHWLLSGVWTEDVIDSLLALPFPAPRVSYDAGKREAYNDSRNYFDEEHIRQFPVGRVVAEALQDRRVTSVIEETFSANLKGCYLRVEYAQDRDGFMLEPHTDIGVKRFTMLIYLSCDPESSTWGTDIYAAPDKHVGTTPFKSNHGLIFIPSDNTWHGFKRRPINGVRRSLIVNYVTDEWRSRHELAFPETPIS